MLFSKIAQDCNCKVSREVSAQPGLVCKPVDLHDSYLVELKYAVPRHSLDRDSLKIVSNGIANKLLKHVISPNAYKTITVMFMIKRANDIFTIIDFTYDGKGMVLTKNLYDYR